MSIILALRRLRQEDPSKSEACITKSERAAGEMASKGLLVPEQRPEFKSPDPHEKLDLAAQCLQSQYSCCEMGGRDKGILEALRPSTLV